MLHVRFVPPLNLFFFLNKFLFKMRHHKYIQKLESFSTNVFHLHDELMVYNRDGK